MFITMLADVTAFLSLVFAFYYYVSLNGSFAFDSLVMEPAAPVGGAVCAVLVAAVLAHLGRRGVHGYPGGWVLLALALLAALGGWALLLGPELARLDPTSHALAAMVWTLFGWVAVHLALGVVMLLFCAAAAVAGRLDREHDAFLRNTELYWYFAAFMAGVSTLVVLALPALT
jgi:hypothetical protein